MKQIAWITAMLTFAAVTVCAHEKQVKMIFSGTSEGSATNLQQPDTSNGADNFAGTGTLGSFTLRDIRTMTNSPTPSSTCSGSNELHFSEPAGGGVLRFHDGSLVYLKLTKGSDCIDLVAGDAHCIVTFTITGGTGRFKDASGVLTMTETVLPVISDAFNNPVFFAATGEFTGTVSGVSEGEKSPEEGQ